MSSMTATGLSLKLARVARDIKASDLAERMQVSRSTLSRLESSRVVPEHYATRYREALATFATVVDVEPASAA